MDKQNDDYDSAFWNDRSRKYDALEWTRRAGYQEKILHAGAFASGDRVLDVGTGTGVMALALAPLVYHVVGVDLSAEMLAKAAEKNHAANITFVQGDVRELNFADATFEKATARMVFHHVLEDAELGIREICRVLKPGGIFVLSEGVPPIPEVRDWYTEMFSYKETRRTFMEDDLVHLAEAGEFTEIKCVRHISKRVSIGNWLDNGAVTETNKPALPR